MSTNLYRGTINRRHRRSATRFEVLALLMAIGIGSLLGKCSAARSAPPPREIDRREPASTKPAPTAMASATEGRSTPPTQGVCRGMAAPVVICQASVRAGKPELEIYERVRMKTHRPNTYCPIIPPFYTPETTGGVNGRWWRERDVERWADKHATGEFSCVIGYEIFHCYPSYAGYGPTPFTCRAMSSDDHCLVF